MIINEQKMIIIKKKGQILFSFFLKKNFSLLSFYYYIQICYCFLKFNHMNIIIYLCVTHTQFIYFDHYYFK